MNGDGTWKVVEEEEKCVCWPIRMRRWPEGRAQRAQAGAAGRRAQLPAARAEREGFVEPELPRVPGTEKLFTEKTKEVERDIYIYKERERERLFFLHMKPDRLGSRSANKLS